MSGMFVVNDLPWRFTRDVGASVAPHAAGTIRWFVAQVGNLGVVIVELLLTVILAAALLAQGEYAAEYFLRFGQRVGGLYGESAVLLAHLMSTVVSASKQGCAKKRRRALV